ncbi:NmrA family NAD(P)-binding protein [Arcticibacter eurypsychrophilus]|uniref:NmrA family NAD(P)-binding protein n=1 Tax=Arcticibacter eurypsychrophilus TaxID=1434752 RepID=UPI00084DE667|nr:NAD(P)H-binding protein [Arcticibacter eurypsychrophilus]
MKIIVTGSLGNISSPLTQALVQQGHSITVISSNPAKQTEIEALGATAAIGSLEDVAFLTETFKGADAVYSMVPPNNYFDPTLDLLNYYRQLGKNYKQAISEAGVKRVVNLSSIGANLEKGNGILLGAHDVEQILNELPSEISITHIRPTSFFYNLFGYMGMIKSMGMIAANYGASDVIPWVSPKDIAVAVAEELVSNSSERKVRYVASEELTADETARILGEAIGKPDLKWIVISDEETTNGLVSIGMNPDIAAGLVEMYAGLHSGLLAEDYYKNKPAKMGEVKLVDFAQDFAAAFQQIN